MNLTGCPLRGPDSIPSHGGVFHGNCTWLIILCQPVLSQRGRKWLNGTALYVTAHIGVGMRIYGGYVYGLHDREECRNEQQRAINI